MASTLLVRTFCALRVKAGQAPGPDGLTYGDLSRREACQVLCELAVTVCAGKYEPGPGWLVCSHENAFCGDKGMLA
jgi:hypothetical protein